MNLLTQDTRPVSDYRTIPLSQNKFAVVDAADYEWLMQSKWCAHKHRNTWYAVRNVEIDGKNLAVMAWVLLGASGVNSK